MVEIIKSYAIVENGVITNIAAATPEHAAAEGWIDLTDIFLENYMRPGIGDLYDGSNFKKNPELIAAKIELLKVEIREERNRLLAETDWWIMPDLTPTQEQLDYRQALRDVPQQEGFPENVVWPIKPN